MERNINSLKTEWTDSIYPSEVRDSFSDLIGLESWMSDYENLESALYWLKTMAENPYNEDLRVLWTALQIIAERNPANIPF